MKTIFRYANSGLLAAAMIALGAVAGLAQDPCADTAAFNAAENAAREANKDKSIAGRKKFVEAGKLLLEKYGTCYKSEDPAADYGPWVKRQIPINEAKIKEMEEAAYREALLGRFNNALKTKNFDELYASGKEVLTKWPDEFRDVEIALGFVGLEETAKTPRVTKWNDDTLRFARQSIQDLESGKVFKTWGVSIVGGFNGQFKSKDDALGWLNYTIGYILFYDKNQKKQALEHLYKATQIASDAKNEAVIYDAIGSYYFDEVKKLADEVTELERQQEKLTDDKVDELKALVEKIKDKVALVNGTSEASIDAYARAHDLAKKNPKTAVYAGNLLKKLQSLYNLRFGKMDGFDTFVANTLKKPLANPLNPVTPIRDPEPVKTTVGSTGTGVGAANGTGVGAANGTGTGGANGSGIGRPTGTGAANGTGVAPKPVVNTTPAKTTTPPKTTPAKPKPRASTKKKTTKRTV